MASAYDMRSNGVEAAERLLLARHVVLELPAQRDDRDPVAALVLALLEDALRHLEKEAAAP